MLDALGRAVAELPVAANPAAAVEWTPTAATPAGVYTVRAETSEHTASTVVIRK